ncbi:MAG: type II secretion system F family protein [Verrucomicrobiales bacterium]|nr:type II secretion system F family protein [Verrucomicrobiales bacterium]MCP5526175.1 type II secretion system F family protein [Verrucomicrobiales bacterium]
MPKFNYVAMDSKGKETRGTMEGNNLNEAINRVKEMGFYPTKVTPAEKGKEKEAKGKKGGSARGKKKGKRDLKSLEIKIPLLSGRVKPKVMTAFTRQLATLVDAGLPLLRGMRVLEKQERNPALKRIIGEIAVGIEGGSTFSEALAQHPKVFNKLYVNMVKAGELGGVLEVVLNRLAEFMEKSQKIKGKVVAAMFYPVAVMIVAVVILAVLMIFVVPKFEQIFADMLEGSKLPGFTQLVLNIANMIKSRTILLEGDAPWGLPVFPGPVVWGIVAFVIVFKVALKTQFVRRLWDKTKLVMPVFGPVISKVAIARFTRTLGTLVSSGVPILQALTIVKETSGNMVVSNAVANIHESVKEGETITAPMDASRVFPPMVISMVDVGEQTGALPEMLMKIADTYEDEVDNAVSAMTSLLEPIMIVFLAVIVGSIVIALFMPLIEMINKLGGEGGGGGGGDD